MIALIHLCLTALLTGLIWTIQCLHYPGFLRIPASAWPAYHRFHTRAITPLVAPLMFAELAASIWHFSTQPTVWLQVICGIPVIQFGLTGLLFVPLHRQLASEVRTATLQQLIRLNWLRTGLWTLEAAALLVACLSR